MVVVLRTTGGRHPGLDLAKNVFHAHGADAAGAPVFRKKLRRDQVLAFLVAQPPCRIAMEACPHWGRAKLHAGTILFLEH